jgi:hypothetical protein
MKYTIFYLITIKMQLFFLSLCPREAAKFACDKHAVKMPLETAQIISTVWYRVNRSAYKLYARLGWLFKPWTNLQHPSILWVEQSFANYKWALDYWGAILEQYTLRYGQTHRCQAMYNNVVTMMPDPSLTREEFVAMTPEFQAVPVELKSDDPVETYRRVYIRDKAYFARWKFTEKPYWWPL